mmetsp:Transcript_5123/g.9678  ORF Transcript_5123/g.9678 Transcript_5123/m.9678 type:complete len:273 (+) Transcript_5123:52-870(+)
MAKIVWVNAILLCVCNFPVACAQRSLLQATAPAATSTDAGGNPMIPVPATWILPQATPNQGSPSIAAGMLSSLGQMFTPSQVASDMAGTIQQTSYSVPANTVIPKARGEAMPDSSSWQVTTETQNTMIPGTPVQSTSQSADNDLVNNGQYQLNAQSASVGVDSQSAPAPDAGQPSTADAAPGDQSGSKSETNAAEPQDEEDSSLSELQKLIRTVRDDKFYKKRQQVNDETDIVVYFALGASTLGFFVMLLVAICTRFRDWFFGPARAKLVFD